MSFGLSITLPRTLREVVLLFLDSGESRRLVVDDALLSEAAAAVGGVPAASASG